MTEDSSRKSNLNHIRYKNPGSLEIFTLLNNQKSNLKSYSSADCIKEPKPLIWSGSLFTRQKDKIKPKEQIFRFKGGGFKGMILNTQRIQGSLPKINLNNRKKGHTKKKSQSDAVIKKVYLPFVYRSVSQLGCFESCD